VAGNDSWTAVRARPGVSRRYPAAVRELVIALDRRSAGTPPRPHSAPGL